MAGGKTLPVADARTMAWKAIDQGAAGVDMGRNIFQRQAPAAMMSAVKGIVHGGLNPQEAEEKYRELRSEEHTSELQSRGHLVCRLLLEKKKNKQNKYRTGRI